MLADVGEGAAGETKHVGRVRIQCDCALGLQVRVFLGSGKVRNERQVGSKGVNQGCERAGEGKVRINRDRLARPAQCFSNGVLVPALRCNSASRPTKMRPGIYTLDS